MSCFKYDCPNCDSEIEGSFGDNTYCKKCDKTYETDWDYVTEDQPSAWLTGVEHKGKIDIDEE